MNTKITLKEIQSWIFQCLRLPDLGEIQVYKVTQPGIHSQQSTEVVRLILEPTRPISGWHRFRNKPRADWCIWWILCHHKKPITNQSRLDGPFLVPLLNRDRGKCTTGDGNQLFFHQSDHKMSAFPLAHQNKHPAMANTATGINQGT